MKNKITIDFEVKVEFDDMRNMILSILFERDYSYTSKINKDQIMANVKQFLAMFGLLSYMNETILARYGNRKEYEEFRLRAERLTYRFFSELSSDENTIKFLNSED